MTDDDTGDESGQPSQKKRRLQESNSADARPRQTQVVGQVRPPSSVRSGEASSRSGESRRRLEGSRGREDSQMDRLLSMMEGHFSTMIQGMKNLQSRFEEVADVKRNVEELSSRVDTMASANAAGIVEVESSGTPARKARRRATRGPRKAPTPRVKVKKRVRTCPNLRMSPAERMVPTRKVKMRSPGRVHLQIQIRRTTSRICAL